MNNKFVLTTILLIALIITTVGLFPIHTFADSTTTQFFPNGVTDTTWLMAGNPLNQVPRTYDANHASVIQLQDIGCPSNNPYEPFVENGVGWPEGVSDFSQNEDKYVEYSFDTSSLPNNAIIDGVSLVSQYFAMGGVDLSSVKLEFINNGTILSSSPLATVGVSHCHNAILQTVAVQNVDTVAKLNALKVRFLAFDSNIESTSVYADEDYMRLDVTYHLPAIPPVAYSQDFPNHSVDTALPITLTATSTNSNSLTYSIVSTSTLGSLSSVTGDQVTYTPNGTLGDDSFVFQVNDGSFTATSTVTIHLSPGSTTALTISATPTNLNVGSSTLLSIAGHDQFGNPTSNDNTTVVNVSSDIGTVDNATVILNGGVATTTAGSAVAGTVTYIASSPLIASSTTSVSFAAPVDDTNPPAPAVVRGGGGLLAVSVPVTPPAPVVASATSVVVATSSTVVSKTPAPVVVSSSTPIVEESVKTQTPVSEPVVSDNEQVATPTPVETDATSSDIAPVATDTTVVASTTEPVVATTSNLGATVVNSNIDVSNENIQKLEVSAFGILLIGGIYMSVWRPFRKK